MRGGAPFPEVMPRRQALDDNTHKVLDFAQHVWPIASGIALTVVAIWKLWWSKAARQREWQSGVDKRLSHVVTKDELQACKVNVMDKGEDTSQQILDEIKAIRLDMRNDNKDNAKAHDTIVRGAAKFQQELMTQIVRLHDKGHH